ncbi:MAG: hypothetical protein LAT76_11495, partial [Schleiferiaceae bacterium]|nr:hypothetical protein [Schleiferiaceae bacterium]
MAKRYALLFFLFSCMVLLAQQYPYDDRFQNIDKNITFIPQLGQWEGEFNHRTKLNKGVLFFKKDGFRASFLDPEFNLHDFKHQSGARTMGLAKNAPDKINGFAYDWKLLGANTNPELIGNQKRKDYHNYFLRQDSTRWRSEVPVYNGLTYKEIYPNIHLHFFGWEDNLKYDFEVLPGGDPEEISFHYEGLTEPLKVENGNLIVTTPYGTIKELAPVAWQDINGKRKQVKIEYQLKESHTVSFKIKRYKSNYTLIIDPTVVFSTFSGGSSDNWGFTATYDSGGHLYTGGISFGQGYPTTVGAFQTNFNFTGVQDPSAGFIADVVVTKFSPNGDNLIYSTFLGGNSSEQPHSMVVDSQDRLLVYGITSSLN